MKSVKTNQLIWLTSLLLILTASTITFGQISESSEESAGISEPVMKQIVSKVLLFYFKPRSQQKVIYLSDEGIKASWLPKIRGIEFRLFDIRQDRSISHYKFANPFGYKNEMGFAYGSWTSGFMGETWRFRKFKRTVKIWRKKDGGWGSSGDDHGNSPPIREPPPPFTEKKKN